MEQARQAQRSSGVKRTRRAQFGWLAAVPASAVALATGCGPGGPAGGERRAAGGPPAKLVWQIRDGPTYEELAKTMLAVFHQQYPHISVSYVAGSAGNNEKTLTMMIAGEGPDVIQNWPPGIWELSAQGQIQNLNEYVRDLKKADVDDFVAYQWQTVQIPTTAFRYGLPTYVDMDVLFYNRSLFKQRGVREPALEWGRDEYATALKQMTFTDSSGARIWGGYKPANSFIRGQNLVTMFGGHVVDPNNLAKTQLDLPPAQQGLEWARARLFDDQTWAPLDPAKRDWQPNSPRDGFLQGRIAMYEEGMYQLQRIAQSMQAEWDIQHVPKGPAKRTALGDTDAWSMWKHSKAKDAAWELLKFVTSKPYYEKQAELDLLIPSRKSVLDHWVRVVRQRFAVLERVNLKVVTDALTTMNYLTPTENFLCQTEAGKVVNPALNQVMRDGTARPIIFRDIKGQIEAAAASCGATFK
jgi:multiple sugar transport system substrate-binding protein